MQAFIFLMLLYPALSISAPRDWNIMDSFGVEEAYQHKTSPTSIMTVVKRGDFEDFNLKDFSLENYIKALPETKSFTHKLVGISEWKITGYEKKDFFKGPVRVILVKIKGSYLRREKDLIEFEEWHHFYGSNFLQLQLIQNKSGQALDELALFNYLQSKWL